MLVRSILLAVAAALLASSGLQAQSTETITLETRAKSEYEKSAFSFRYRSQDLEVHKNHVDFTFENGKLRINHHIGLESRIADLGEVNLGDVEEHLEEMDEGNWQSQAVEPVEGHTYVIQLVADGHEMQVEFRIDKLYSEELEFSWIPADLAEWPVSIERRGAAGVSGFRPSSSGDTYRRIR